MAEKIKNRLKQFVETVDAKLGLLSAVNPIHRTIYETLSKDKKMLEKIQRTFEDALREKNGEKDHRAVRSDGGKAENKKSNKPAYDYSKSFDEQLDDFKKGKNPKYEQLLVCKTPEIWQKIGMNALSVTINQKSVKRALFGTKDADHFLGETMLRDLPRLLADPVAIIRSQADVTPDSLVVIVAEKVNGHQVIAAVELDGQARFNNNESTFDIEVFRGAYCIGGVDLSITTDLTCASLLLMKRGDDKKYIAQMCRSDR